MNKVELIKKHEGYRSRPYYCTEGKYTVGYGRNLDDNGIRKDEAQLMLANDLKDCESQVEDNIDCFNKLSEVRQAVLINMVFNLGWPRLSKFNKMLLALDNGDFGRASEEMLDSRWARQVGNRAIELSDMMKINEWQ